MSAPSAAPAATPNDPAWVGCDVSKLTMALAVDFPRRNGQPPIGVESLPSREFPRTPQGLEQAMAWVSQILRDADGADERPVRFVMESTGNYSFELVSWLLERHPSTAPAMVHAGQASSFIASLGMRTLDDCADARGLARLGSTRWPPAYDMPTRERIELRELLRLRIALIENRTAHKNRLGQMIECRTVRLSIERQIRQIDKEIERLEKQARKVLAKMPPLAQDCEKLESMYGVGWVTATTVVAELGDLRRFHRARQLSAFAGLAPSRKTSGSSVNRKLPSKRGSSQVRRALYMAAHAVVKGDNDLAKVYRTKKAEGNPANKALTIVMRKLLLAMRSILVHEAEWNPHRRLPLAN